MTAETFAGITGTALLIYICCGILFSIAFIAKGITKTDEAAHGSGWGFKIIIIPGVIALWPVLLVKWMKAKKNILKPTEE
jgi:hypothetical protein